MLAAQVLRRKERWIASKHAAAIAAPVLTTYTIPATGMYALVSRAGNAALASAMTVVGPRNHTIGAPSLATGERHLIGKLERGSVVTLNAAVDLYLNTARGKFKRVARGA